MLTMAAEFEPGDKPGMTVDGYLSQFEVDKPVEDMSLEELAESTSTRSISVEVQGGDGQGEAVDRQIEEVVEMHKRL